MSFVKLEQPAILRGMSTGPCWQGIYHDDQDDADYGIYDDDHEDPERDV